MISRSVIFSLAIFIQFHCFSQQYFFTRYSIEEGLSQSVVNCIFQDSKGYIWFGTQNGLNKFNGYTFEIFTYNPTDSASLSNNWVYSINEDLQGNLWVGTKSGLNKFIRKEKRFERFEYQTGYPNDVTAYPYDVITSFNGTIIVNTPPVLSVYYPDKKEFRHHISQLEYDGAVQDNKIPVIEDFEGLLWIGTTKGLCTFDRNTQKFRYFFHDENNENSVSDNRITALYEDRKGNIWIGTSNGLNVFNKVTRTFKKYFHNPVDPSSLSNNYIRAITEDKSGNLWIGTEGGGLDKMRFTGETKEIFERFNAENSGLSHDIVFSLKIDKSDNLWIGTLQGITKTDLKKRKFHLYRRSNAPNSVDLLGNVIASIYKDDNGILWIGNWGQGLNLFDRKTGKVEHFSSRHTGNYYIPNDFVHVIFKDSDKRIWIGTRDGILIYDAGKNSFTRFKDFIRDERLPDFSGVRIFMIIQDREQNYWIGTQNGLFKINLASGSSEIFTEGAVNDHRVSSNLIYCLVEDREGLIWIATLDGLDVYNPRNRKITHYQRIKDSPNSLVDNFVITLCEDHNGDIWIGTSSYVNKFVKKDSAFIYYSQENGLPNNRIFEILEDNSRNLWFATGHGLSRFDTITGSFKTYPIEDGLQGLEFNLRASHKSNDGEVFFGGMNGFNSFYPDSLAENPVVPEIDITSFYVTKRGRNDYRIAENAEKIVLGYNENSFTIEFAALEFTNPRENRYAYKMEGIDENWNEVGSRNFIQFSNLPPGDYVFKVKGSNNDGKWNSTGKILKIIIRPPWWRSIPAYIVYFLLFILIVVLYINMRERHLVKERNILEQRVNQRTLQIERQKAEIVSKNEELKELNATKDKFFSIIAHDLRNPFNSIIGLSDILLSDYERHDKAKILHLLSSIKEASGQAFDLLQNLLFWARSQTGRLEFQPVPFDLKSRVDENIQVVESQADKKNIRLFSTIGDGFTVTGDMNMIDTVLRNLLTNAIKFTPHDGKIVIEAKMTDNFYEISVTDSGIGISGENIHRLFRIDSKYTTKGTEKERGTGLGLILCREFIEKHGGKIWVESEPGKGSTFRFTLPVSKDGDR